MNSNGRGKTFLYRFDAETKLNFVKLLFNVTEKGACHGDDIMYLFRSNLPGMEMPDMDSKEFELIRNMVSLLTSFMTSGDPNNFEDGQVWEPTVALSPIKCLNISNDSIEMKPLPEEKRLKRWDEIFADTDVTPYTVVKRGKL